MPEPLLVGLLYPDPLVTITAADPDPEEIFAEPDPEEYLRTRNTSAYPGSGPDV